MELSLKFKGDKQLTENLKKLNRSASGRALRSAAKAGAEEIVQEAKRRVPVDTGKTKKYIRAFTASRPTSTSVTMSIGVTAKTRQHVARFLELGTSKMGAKPFLRPALDEQQKKAAEVTQSTMAKEVLAEVQKSGSTPK